MWSNLDKVINTSKFWMLRTVIKKMCKSLTRLQKTFFAISLYYHRSFSSCFLFRRSSSCLALRAETFLILSAYHYREGSQWADAITDTKVWVSSVEVKLKDLSRQHPHSSAKMQITYLSKIFLLLGLYSSDFYIFRLYCSVSHPLNCGFHVICLELQFVDAPLSVIGVAC